MNIDYHRFPIKNILAIIQHYDAKKYWKRREYVVNGGGLKLLKLFYLLYIKRCDAFNKASMGTDLNQGAEFKSTPRLPHGLNGIIVSPYAKIGKNAYIFHQVTIGDDGVDKHNVPTIGDNVTIYAGAKVVGKCYIGDGAKIGANCVVNFDVPPKAIVTLNKPKMKIMSV